MTPPTNPPTPEQRERARALLACPHARDEGFHECVWCEPLTDSLAAALAAEYARGHAAGQEAMRERAALVCSDISTADAGSYDGDREFDGACKAADLVRALAIEPAKEE